MDPSRAILPRCQRGGAPTSSARLVSRADVGESQNIRMATMCAGESGARAGRPEAVSSSHHRDLF